MNVSRIFLFLLETKNSSDHVIGFKRWLGYGGGLALFWFLVGDSNEIMNISEKVGGPNLIPESCFFSFRYLVISYHGQAGNDQ